MAIQQVNVYSFDIHLKSKHNAGEHIPTRVLAAGATPAAAQAVLQQQFGSDLVLVSSGVLTSSGIYTTLA